jgi:hypothetical protein
MNAKTTRPRRTAPKFDADRFRVELAKRAQSERYAVCSECFMVARYPAAVEPETVLADLARWAADPAYLPSLPGRVCCKVRWEWSPGEQLALWRAGRLLALVSKSADGGVEVTRFDRPAP